MPYQSDDPSDSSESVQLTDRVPQEVTPYLLADLSGGLPAPPFATYRRMLRRGALARLPVSSFTVNPPITVPVNQDLSTIPGWLGMMAGLATVIVIGSPSGGIRTGLVALSSAHAVPGMGHPRFALTAPTFVSEPNEDLFAHEMGHTHGLNHPICAGTESWPYDDRLPRRTDLVGMHIEDGAVMPRGTSELMSYCMPPPWPSGATYNLVYDNPA